MKKHHFFNVKSGDYFFSLEQKQIISEQKGWFHLKLFGIIRDDMLY